MLKLDFRKMLVWVLSFVLLLALVVGFGVVDNQIKLSQNNPFLNTFLIDFKDKFVYLRYFAVDFKIQFGISAILESILNFFKPLISVIIVIFAKIFIC